MGGKRAHYGQDTGKIRTIDGRWSWGDRPTTDNQPAKPRNPHPPSTDAKSTKSHHIDIVSEKV